MDSKDRFQALDTDDGKDNTGQMVGVGIMSFILFLSTLVGLPVLPALAIELGAGPTGAAFVVSAALMTVVSVQFFAGVLADRYSKRRLILIGALMGAISSLLCVFANHWTQLAALRILGGIADAIAMPALLATTASLGKNTPGKFFGILRGSQGLSFVIGPALGAAFSLRSLRTPFFVDGVLSLIAFFVAMRLLAGTEKAKSEHNLRVFQSLRTTLSTPRFFLFLLMGISGLFGFGVLSCFIPIKSLLVGLEAWQIGLILTGGALSFSSVSFIIGTLSDKFGRRVFVIISQVIMVIGCTGLALHNTFSLLLIYYCIFCVGEATTFLLSFVYAAEIFSKENIGTSMGVFDSLMDLSLLIAPLLALSVHKVSGNIPLVIMLGSIPAVFTLVGLIFWLPREKTG
ncbi:MAG: MFS transporter [Thermodesulfobacteriota bacterium]